MTSIEKKSVKEVRFVIASYRVIKVTRDDVMEVFKNAECDYLTESEIDKVMKKLNVASRITIDGEEEEEDFDEGECDDIDNEILDAHGKIYSDRLENEKKQALGKD